MAPVKEAVFERSFDASPETIWRAWTDPKMIKDWWGPNDISIPECEVDLRVGGKIYIVMEAEEAMGPYKGTRWPMEGRFTRVEMNSKLSYTASGWTEGDKEATEINQVTELTLIVEKGKTKLKLNVTINKAGPNADMAVQGMQVGFNQHLDKLGTFMARQWIAK